MNEIVQPIIGNTPVKIETTTVWPERDDLTGVQYPPHDVVNYSLNVSYFGTGILEIKKSVAFDVGVDAEKFALYGGVIGSLLSLLYVIANIMAQRMFND